MLDASSLSYCPTRLSLSVTKLYYFCVHTVIYFELIQCKIIGFDLFHPCADNCDLDFLISVLAASWISYSSVAAATGDPCVCVSSGTI